MNFRSSLVAAALLLVGGAAQAVAHAEPPKTTLPAETDRTDGEVRKVDLDARKVTIRHAEIKSLGMPAMTMVFQVRDPALLERIKAGDKVRFVTEKIGGAYTVTEIEVAK